MKNNPEMRAQIMLFEWISFHPHIAPFCFSIPNERKASRFHGALLKQMGLRPGASDVFVAIPRGDFHGMFLELKEGRNKPNDRQLKFMDDMRSQGYYCVWKTGFEKARLAITEYLGDYFNDRRPTKPDNKFAY